MNNLFVNACPHCNHAVEFAPEFSGQVMDCPECGGQFRLSGPAQRPSVPLDQLALDPRKLEQKIKQNQAAKPSSAFMVIFGVWLCFLFLVTFSIFYFSQEDISSPHSPAHFFHLGSSAFLFAFFFASLSVIGNIVYMLPALIAFFKGKKNRIAICVLNIVAGWTFLGWVVALVWSFMVDKPNS